MNLLDVMAAQPSPSWVVARVQSVNLAKKRVTLVVGALGDPSAQRLTNVSYLKHYTPVVGDVVHVLVQTNIGALVLGAT